MIDGEEKVAALKMAVGAGGSVWYALTLNEWVALVTLLYLLLQIGLLVPKYVLMIRGYFQQKKIDG